jgi:hypothetical protein
MLGVIYLSFIFPHFSIVFSGFAIDLRQVQFYPLISEIRRGGRVMRRSKNLIYALFIFATLQFNNQALAEVESTSLSNKLSNSETSSSTNATEGTSSYKIQGLKNKEFADDNKLTDIRLRAAAGSLSRYSANANLLFLGPSVGNPSEPDRPNPDKTIRENAQTLNGNLSFRYRFDSDHTLALGGGMAIVHPLQGADRTNANNPFIAYSVAENIGGVEMLISPGITYFTVPAYKAVGEVGGATLTDGMVFHLGNSRYSLSLDISGSYWYYNRPYQKPTRKSLGDSTAQQMSAMSAPGLKYSFNDHLVAFASVDFQISNPRAVENNTTWQDRTPSSRMGLSYAYDRAIFISPFIQTYPSLMSADATTMNIATIFSVL